MKESNNRSIDSDLPIPVIEIGKKFKPFENISLPSARRIRRGLSQLDTVVSTPIKIVDVTGRIILNAALDQSNLLVPTTTPLGPTPKGTFPLNLSVELDAKSMEQIHNLQDLGLVFQFPGDDTEYLLPLVAPDIWEAVAESISKEDPYTVGNIDPEPRNFSSVLLLPYDTQRLSGIEAELVRLEDE
jgi:hypothetical protein